MFETFWPRIRGLGRLLLGGVGFLLIGYASLVMYETHQRLRQAPLDPRVSYEEAFIAAAEPQLLLLGAGVVVVVLAAR